MTSSPIKVKGVNAHPIYSWIKNEYNKMPRWNFYKYLFNRKAKLIGTWSSFTKPSSFLIKRKINSII